MKYLSFLIKPASSSCNMACRYCFYYDVSEHREIKSYGVMDTSTMEILIDKAFAILDDDGEVTFAFQGGEPTLATIRYFKHFFAYVENIKKVKQQIHYALQTNGQLIDDEWCQLFKAYDVLVGISLDGYKEHHDYMRLGKHQQPTYKKVMQAIQYLRNYQIEFNILTVLSTPLAKHPQKVYDFYKREHFTYVQFIPCLPALEKEQDTFSLTPELFASFYKRFFALWYEDTTKGLTSSIRLFDNIILMFADMLPQECGMLGKCQIQLVVESDGSVYPCDFYVLDQYKGGNIRDIELQEIMQSKPMIDFLKEERAYTKKCVDCPFVSVCHGNCKRMSTVYYHDDYCGYQDFLQYAYPYIQKIAKQIRK